MTGAPTAWHVEVDRSTAADLHTREATGDEGHSAWFLDSTDTALVLGSTQSADAVDRDVLAEHGVAVVRRRSGGGVVLVGDGGSTWLDLVVPRGSPLWDDDVGRAMHWVGALWSGALAELGVATTVHRGGLSSGEWGRQICFGGLGPGEVCDGDGRKVVGVSQRRTRHAARFQTIAYHRAPWAATVALLALAPEERDRARAALASSAGVVEVDPAALRDRLVAHLPALD